MISLIRTVTVVAIVVAGCRFDPDNCLEPGRTGSNSGACVDVSSSASSSASSESSDASSVTSSAGCTNSGSWRGSTSVAHTDGRKCFNVTVSPGCGVPVDISVYVRLEQYWVGGLTLDLTPPQGDPDKPIKLLERLGAEDTLSAGLSANLVGDPPLRFSPEGMPLQLMQHCWPNDGNVICKDNPAVTDFGTVCVWDPACSFAPKAGFGDLSGLVSAGDWTFCVTVDPSVGSSPATVTSVEIKVTHE